ncbi:MAG: transposase [Bacteroidales bacterium]|nr:transposase [Bacteroidales bacterium]
MNNKFQNKYRIASVRAQWWDYGWNGAYFITICTQNRECFLGEIVGTADGVANMNADGGTADTGVETRLIASLQQQKQQQFNASPLGRLAEKFWHEIHNHFPYCELGDFVAMPNHIHGILILNKPGDAIVKTRLIASLQSTIQIKTGGFAGIKNPMVNENISRIRWYKGRCAFEMRKIHADFSWQSRFHDHVIRNDAEYQRISDYIINNPANWKDDKFYSV